MIYLFLTFMFFSCNLFYESQYKIEFPTNTNDFFTSGKIVYFFNKNKCELEVDIYEDVYLKVDRHHNSVVLFYPEKEFYPAAAIFPNDFRDGKIYLEWQNGLIANILEKVPVDISKKIDTVYLSNKIFSLSSNCWDIDKDKLVQDIIHGSLNGYSVKLLPKIDIVIPNSHGLWASQYIAGTLFHSDLNGNLSVKIKHGINYFYSMSSKKIIGVFYSDNDEYTILEFFY